MGTMATFTRYLQQTGIACSTASWACCHAVGRYVPTPTNRGMCSGQSLGPLKVTMYGQLISRETAVLYCTTLRRGRKGPSLLPAPCRAGADHCLGCYARAAVLFHRHAWPLFTSKYGWGTTMYSTHHSLFPFLGRRILQETCKSFFKPLYHSGP